MKSLKKIKSLLTKEDIIFHLTMPERSIYADFYNNCQTLNRSSSFYMYTIEQMMNEYNRLLHKIYDNSYFINSINKYQEKLSIYKEILNEFDNRIYFKKMPLFVNDINSFFYIQRHFSTSRTEISITIRQKDWNYQHLYFDVDKKYTKIINYLGFLNKFQYDILYNYNNSLSDYLYYRIEIHPQYLNIDSLKDQLYYIITDYINENKNVNIDEIKNNWLLPEFTDKDMNYFSSCLAKKLLMKI